MPPTMYDSTTPGAIPTSAALVAGYLDGEFAWRPVDWARFPSAQHVGITVVGQAGATVADVEKGDLSTGGGVAWARAELAAGRWPTIYASESSHSDLVAAGLDPRVKWWAADPTGAQHLVPGSVATQYAWPGKASAGAFDLSVTDGVWPGTLSPVTKPAVVAVMNQPGSDTGYWLVAADGGVFTFGGATFYGSMGGKQLSAPVVDGDAAADGKGYRLVGADGAVYDFGSAVYEGGTNT